jgi:hypothetical protein
MAIVIGPTFTAGTAISNVISVTNADPYLIITPPVWTPANLSFLISPDSTNFYPLYIGGKLWELACPPNAALSLATTTWPKGIFLRFLSGVIDAPIIQTEERVFKVVTGTSSLTTELTTP